MTAPVGLKAAHIGLQRFGLGVRPREAQSLRLESRDRLLAEIGAGPVAQPVDPPFSGAAEAGAAIYAFEDRQKARREARRAADMTGPAQPPNPAPPSEPALPFATYRDEVKARVNLALDVQAGLAERLVMFWSNHFCISVAKSSLCRTMAGAYEREAIRPHVFGRFEEMLVAATSHPAMLDFLDNRISVGPRSPAGRRRRRGLNENLAREILELHTLGVSGGYAQDDVTSLAAIITGWTVVGREAMLGFPGSFAFNPQLHEPGAPLLLGKRYDQPGKAKGLAALRDLARHPATADFIALKLARHFVADEPPSSLVAELSGVFRRTGGDLAAVARALVESNPAWTAEPAKLRSPQQFLMASYRALGRKPEIRQILGQVGVLGQPFWQPPGPNGYPDTNDAWTSAQGVKARIDVAAGLGRQAAASLGDPRELTEDILGPIASFETRQAVARAESKPQALALLLMSPEFQRR